MRTEKGQIKRGKLMVAVTTVDVQDGDMWEPVPPEIPETRNSTWWYWKRTGTHIIEAYDEGHIGFIRVAFIWDLTHIEDAE